MLAHLLRRHVAWIDRRISGREQREQRRLRLLQMKDRLVIAVGGDPIEVPVPRFARVDAELGSRPAEQHVPGALDILCGEGCPSCQRTPSRRRKVSSVPSSFHDQLVARSGHDRLQCVLRHMLVENDEIVEHRHHRRDGGNRHFLERGHARRAVAMGNLQHAARLLRQCGSGGQTRSRQRRCRRKPRKTPDRIGWQIEMSQALFVEPDVFVAPAVVDAVDHDRQPFDLGLPAGRRRVDRR